MKYPIACELACQLSATECLPDVASPLPDNAILTVLPLNASLVTDSVPVDLPAAEGLKPTDTVTA